MHFELWDVESGNLLDDFDAEADALLAIGSLLANNEPDMAEELMLLRVGGQDGGGIIASGPDLARRARAACAQRGRLTA